MSNIIAFSSSGKFVDDFVAKNVENLKSSSLGFGPIVNQAHEELLDIWDECKEADWDGYNALPISWDAYNLTRRFLDALPLGIPIPSLAPAANGHMHVEWYIDPRQLLTVSVSDSGLIFFSGMFGPNRYSGKIAFVDETPKEILALIQRLFS